MLVFEGGGKAIIRGDLTPGAATVLPLLRSLRIRSFLAAFSPFSSPPPPLLSCVCVVAITALFLLSSDTSTSLPRLRGIFSPGLCRPLNSKIKVI